MPEDYVDIGRVRSVNPAKREVRVTVRAGYAGAYENLNWLELEPVDGERVRCQVTECRMRNSEAIVALSAGVSRDRVAVFKGARAMMPARDVPPPDPFEVRASEYDGFAVEDEHGARLGTVVGGMATPTHGVIEIETAPGESALAPVVPEVVSEVDWDGRRLVLRDVERFRVEDDGGPKLV